MRAILHIGTHKTGTSAIQSALSLNEPAVRAAGICYPRLSGLTLAKGAFQHSEIARLLYRDGGAAVDLANKLKAEADGFHTMVLSSEDWFPLPHDWRMGLYARCDIESGILAGAEKTIAMLRTITKDVRVVCYVRRMDLWIESLYNQEIKRLKAPVLTSPLEAFASEISGWHFARHLDIWRRLVGTENLIVRPYERSQLEGGDVIRDIIGRLGLTLTVPSLPADDPNSRLSRTALEYVRRRFREGRIKPYHWQPLVDAIEKVSDLMLARHPEPPGWKNLLPLAQRQRILEASAEFDRQVAHTYLGRNDGKLFYELENYDADYPALSDEVYNQFDTEVEKRLRIKHFHPDNLVAHLSYLVRNAPVLRRVLSPLGQMYQRHIDRGRGTEMKR